MSESPRKKCRRPELGRHVGEHGVRPLPGQDGERLLEAVDRVVQAAQTPHQLAHVGEDPGSGVGLTMGLEDRQRGTEMTVRLVEPAADPGHLPSSLQAAPPERGRRRQAAPPARSSAARPWGQPARRPVHPHGPGAGEPDHGSAGRPPRREPPRTRPGSGRRRPRRSPPRRRPSPARCTRRRRGAGPCGPSWRACRTRPCGRGPGGSRTGRARGSAGRPGRERNLLATRAASRGSSLVPARCPDTATRPCSVNILPSTAASWISRPLVRPAGRRGGRR